MSKSPDPTPRTTIPGDCYQPRKMYSNRDIGGCQFAGMLPWSHKTRVVESKILRIGNILEYLIERLVVISDGEDTVLQLFRWRVRQDVKTYRANTRS